MKMFKAVDQDFRIPVKTGVKMHITKIEKHLYLIDVETARIKNFIASYILKGRHVAIVETGPASSVSNLLFGLEELNINPEDVIYVAVSHIHLDHGGGVGMGLSIHAGLAVLADGTPNGRERLARCLCCDMERELFVTLWRRRSSRGCPLRPLPP